MITGDVLAFDFDLEDPFTTPTRRTGTTAERWLEWLDCDGGLQGFQWTNFGASQ